MSFLVVGTLGMHLFLGGRASQGEILTLRNPSSSFRFGAVELCLSEGVTEAESPKLPLKEAPVPKVI